MSGRAAARAAAVVAAGAVAAGGAGPAEAGGFAVSEQTITAAGTAGAGAARDGEAGAAWTNPAALADGEGLRASAALVAARPSLTAEALDGAWHARNEPAWATPPSLTASYARGRGAAGLALGVPFGSGVAWPAAWPGQFQSTRTQLTVLRAAPFFAWAAAGGRVRLAAGPHLDVALLHVGRDLDFIDTTGSVAIDLHGVGVGVDAAAFVRAAPALALGLTYRGRTHVALAGVADFTAPDAFATKTPDQAVTTDLTLPDRLVLGARWTRGAVAALADAELTLWGTYDALALDFAAPQTPDVRQRQDWGTTLALRAGAEVAAAPRLVVRGGAAWDPSPAPASTLAPSSPDASRLLATLGASYAVGAAVRVDAFAEYLALRARDSANMDALAARYGGSALLIGLGVRVEPGAR